MTICVERLSKQVQCKQQQQQQRTSPRSKICGFQLLHMQISTAEAVSACCVPDKLSPSINADVDEDREATPVMRAFDNATLASTDDFPLYSSQLMPCGGVDVASPLHGYSHGWLRR